MSKSYADRPSATQISAFLELSADERFAWYCSMLELCFAMSTRETRIKWREAKDKNRRPSSRS